VDPLRTLPAFQAFEADAMDALREVARAGGAA
jgi:hypothetical protein